MRFTESRWYSEIFSRCRRQCAGAGKLYFILYVRQKHPTKVSWQNERMLAQTAWLWWNIGSIEIESYQSDKSKVGVPHINLHIKILSLHILIKPFILHYFRKELGRKYLNIYFDLLIFHKIQNKHSLVKQVACGPQRSPYTYTMIWPSKHFNMKSA